MRYWERRRLWDQECRTRPYQATSDSMKPRPSKKIRGDYFAIIINRGTRKWAFTKMADRDAFVDKHGGHRVFTTEERAAFEGVAL